MTRGREHTKLQTLLGGVKEALGRDAHQVVDTLENARLVAKPGLEEHEDKQ